MLDKRKLKIKILKKNCIVIPIINCFVLILKHVMLNIRGDTGPPCYPPSVYTYDPDEPQTAGSWRSGRISRIDFRKNFRRRDMSVWARIFRWDPFVQWRTLGGRRPKHRTIVVQQQQQQQQQYQYYCITNSCCDAYTTYVLGNNTRARASRDNNSTQCKYTHCLALVL
jgi:hypothetical protein